MSLLHVRGHEAVGPLLRVSRRLFIINHMMTEEVAIHTRQNKTMSLFGIDNDLKIPPAGDGLTGPDGRPVILITDHDQRRD